MTEIPEGLHAPEPTPDETYSERQRIQDESERRALPAGYRYEIRTDSGRVITLPWEWEEDTDS